LNKTLDSRQLVQLLADIEQLPHELSHSKHSKSFKNVFSGQKSMH
jgi:hypothetical protein